MAVVEELARIADAGLSGDRGAAVLRLRDRRLLPAALGADVLTSTWDQNTGINSLTPAAAAIEVVAGRWVVEALGLPAARRSGW